MYGYGVRLDFTNAEKLHLHNLVEYLEPDMKECYDIFLSDNELEDSEESFSEFTDDYLSNVNSSESGLSALLADLILENDGINLSCDDGCIYLSPDYPWRMNERVKALSREEYEYVIRKWVNVITDEELKFETFYFEV